MKIVRLILGVIVGLMAITFVAELIEFSTVKLVSGKSFAELSSNQEVYFEIRNQWGILVFKILYNFVAAMVGGYLVTWIAKSYATIGLYSLMGIQTLSLIWTGFLSELSDTGPLWMWIALLIVTPLGIYLGYRQRITQSSKLDGQ